MCFFFQLKSTAQTLEERFNADADGIIEGGDYNGFTHPKTPVITNTLKDKIQLFEWGLLPSWAKDKDFQKNTLNARIETLEEKPSFKHSVNNRCLVLLDGFFEWQWQDEKGKVKQKYLIQFPDKQPFAIAGLYNDWTDKTTGEVIHTYTIITTEANELMSVIHNSKMRMPFLLRREEEKLWLNGNGIDYHRDIDLIAQKL